MQTNYTYITHMKSMNDNFNYMEIIRMQINYIYITQMTSMQFNCMESL